MLYIFKINDYIYFNFHENLLKNIDIDDFEEN